MRSRSTTDTTHRRADVLEEFTGSRPCVDRKCPDWSGSINPLVNEWGRLGRRTEFARSLSTSAAGRADLSTRFVTFAFSSAGHSADAGTPPVSVGPWRLIGS
jgi:hypothetical protein